MTRKAWGREAAVSVERIGSPGTRLVIVGSGGTIERRVEAADHAGAIDGVFIICRNSSKDSISRSVGITLESGGVVGCRFPRDWTSHCAWWPQSCEAQADHGGFVDDLQKIEQLDPTHMPQSPLVVEAVRRRFPNVPRFACFDTAFHR